MTVIQRAERGHIAFGHGRKQRLIARAAVHDLTVAPPARKRFTPRRKFPGPDAPAKYTLPTTASTRCASARANAVNGHVDCWLARTIRDPAIARASAQILGPATSAHRYYAVVRSRLQDVQIAQLCADLIWFRHAPTAAHSGGNVRGWALTTGYAV